MGMGELLSLSCAISWSVGVILLKNSGQQIPPFALNLFKTWLAIFLFVPTLLFFPSPFPSSLPLQSWMLLIASGIIGMAIADTLFLYSLNLIGASLTAIVDCLYSPLVILLSLLFLHETMTLWQVLGCLLILAAIIVISQNKANGPQQKQPHLTQGIIIGIFTQIFIVVSIVIIKPVLPQISLVWATLIRLLAGGIGMIILFPFLPVKLRDLSALRGHQHWSSLIAGSIFSTYLAILLWIGGMKYTQASIAAVLNQSATLFTIILAVFFLKEPLTKQKVMAALIGTLGVLLVTI